MEKSPLKASKASKAGLLDLIEQVKKNIEERNLRHTAWNWEYSTLPRTISSVRPEDAEYWTTPPKPKEDPKMMDIVQDVEVRHVRAGQLIPAMSAVCYDRDYNKGAELIVRGWQQQFWERKKKAKGLDTRQYWLSNWCGTHESEDVPTKHDCWVLVPLFGPKTNELGEMAP